MSCANEWICDRGAGRWWLPWKSKLRNMKGVKWQGWHLKSIKGTPNDDKVHFYKVQTSGQAVKE